MLFVNFRIFVCLLYTGNCVLVDGDSKESLKMTKLFPSGGILMTRWMGNCDAGPIGRFS